MTRLKGLILFVILCLTIGTGVCLAEEAYEVTIENITYGRG